MAQIFISYSRKNIDFAKKLTGVLQERGLDSWVDWEGIPPTVDWMKEIEKGIEEADTFLFIISPDSIQSKACKDELDLASRNGKRLIPVVAHEVSWNEVPANVSHLNYIFFRKQDDFDTALEKLLTAIHTDYGWVQTHRRLQVKALEWERGSRDSGFFLRGRDLEEAERQVLINASKDPHPTEVQREYILNSRQATNRQRRTITGMLAALVAVLLGIIALLIQPYVAEALAKSQARDQSQMLLVPQGSIEFQLGDTAQTIELPEFNIEMQAVTNQVYGLCVDAGKCTPPIGSAGFNDSQKQGDPVVWLTIVQAATYCEWVGRRLPSAPEWERAAQLFARSPQNEQHFVLSEIWEWTSSYQEADLPFSNGVWDGQLNNWSIVNWTMLQELGSLSAAGDLELSTNVSGAFGPTANLGFRCVSQ